MRTNKRIWLALMLTLIMVVQSFGTVVLAATPTGDNLVWDGSKLRDGVYITQSRAQYNQYLAYYAVDNDASTAWRNGDSSISGDDSYGWIQINLPCPMNLSGIYFKGFDVNTDRSFKVEVSNDKAFATSVVTVIDATSSTRPAAAFDDFYSTGLTGAEKYQYIRYTKLAASGARVITMHPYGTWETPSRVVGSVELQSGADVLAAASDSSADAANLLDGVESTVWKVDSPGADTPYAQIDLGKQCFIDEIDLIPISSDHSTDFEILLSNDENFTTGAQIFSQVIKHPVAESATASTVKAYTNDIITTYRYIRIAKLDPNVSGRTKSNVSGYTSAIGFADIKVYGKADIKCEVASTVPADGQTGVTNIESKNPFVTINFGVDMNQETLNKDNIKIVKTADSEEVTEYTPITASKSYKIPLHVLESNTQYTVTVSTDVKSTENISVEAEESFNFTTGTILNISYVPGKVIKNVAKGKTLEVFDGTTENPITVTNKGALIDGSLDAGSDVAFQIGGTGGNLNANTNDINANGWLFKIDLGNYYDIQGVKLVTRASDSNSKWDTANLSIGGSVSDGKLSDGVTYFTTDNQYGIGNTTGGTTAVGAAKYGNGECTYMSASAIRHRYIYGLKTTQRVYLAELEVYAQVSEDFGVWNTPAISGNNYTFSIPTERYTEGEKYYMVAAGYDANGYITGTIVANEVAITDGNLSITAVKTADTTKFKAVVLKSLSGGGMLVDAYEYSLQ